MRLTVCTSGLNQATAKETGRGLVLVRATSFAVTAKTFTQGQAFKVPRLGHKPGLK